jgi:hypothetical protein
MNIASQGMIRFTALACIGMVGVTGPRWSEGQTQPPAPAGVPDTSASHSSAQSEAGEPRATTSPDAPSAAEGSPGAAPAEPPHEEASRAGQRAQPAKAAGKTEPAGKAAGTGKAEGAGKAEGSGKSAPVDRLELQTATVTGDREQPKVMYIVPWKRSDIGDLSGKPMNSLLDEALAPVDRDEFKREVVYYQAVRADASQNGAAAKGPTGAQAPPR